MHSPSEGSSSYRGRDRGSFSYRGRGRGTDNILAQHGDRRLVTANLSNDGEYQEYLALRRSREGNTFLGTNPQLREGNTP